jgi:hypothetical protein
MELLCGQEWYDAHLNVEYPKQSIEVYFDDKRLATVSTDMKYNKGVFKAIADAEISKHPEDFYQSKHKWYWIYKPEQTPPIVPEIVNPVITQVTAIIEDMTFADMTVCVG